MPNPLFQRDQSQWKTDDKEWVSKRKKEWKQVTTRLRSVSDWIDDQEVKDLQEYFLTGTVDYSYDIYFGKELVGPCPHWYLRDIVLQLWFYPGEIDLSDLTIGDGYAIQLEYHRKRLFVTLETMHRAIKSDDSEYGLMNGREGIVSMFLNPKLDYLDTHQFGEKIEGGGCLSPADLYRFCISNTNYEITNFSKPNRYRRLQPECTYVQNTAGLVLWSHLDYALEHYPEQSFMISPGKSESERAATIERFENRLDDTLGELIKFFDRPEDDEARKRKLTSSFVEELIKKYERKEFSPAMLTSWDRAKKNLTKKKK